MTVEEIVARALADEIRKHANYGMSGADAYGGRTKEFHDMARAAVHVLESSGYRVVPVEATDAMVKATGLRPGVPLMIWRAMLDAAGGSTTAGVNERAEGVE